MEPGASHAFMRPGPNGSHPHAGCLLKGIAEVSGPAGHAWCHRRHLHCVVAAAAPRTGVGV